MPKGISEAVNQRKPTDKRTLGQTLIYTTLYRKPKRTQLPTECDRCFGPFHQWHSSRHVFYFIALGV